MAEILDDEVQLWLDYISEYDREFKKWEGRVEKIIKRYRSDRPANADGAKFNVLWSNVQVLVPATFSKVPRPDCSRRFRDNDPVGRVAALLIERGLDYEIQHYPWYKASLKQCVLDRFLGGRATAWVRYEPSFKKADATGIPEDGLEVTEDVEAEEDEQPQEVLDYECTPIDYVHWKDFGHTVARTWEEVDAVWRKVYMTRAQCEERFEDGDKIPLDSKPDKSNKDYTSDATSKALIYEIWCKSKKKAYWLSKTLGKFVDEKDDPLQLEQFFPCPRPLFATLTNDTLVPVPDFVIYQDQANELDILSDRIDGLIKALKVRGVYNAEFKELARLFTEGENNSLIPVSAWNAFAEKQGLKGAIDIVDITPIASALVDAYKAFAEISSKIDQLSGVIDVMRGSVDPDEKLGQTQMKGNTSSLRLRSMQKSVAEFASELLQIMSQVICGQYEVKTILQIAAADQLSPEDKQVLPQAIELLLGERAVNPEAPPSTNPLRSFRIEVDADSLVEMDEQQEKQDRMEFLKANGDFMTSATQMMEKAGPAAADLAPVIMELWKFGVTAFKVGKTVESVIDQCADKLRQAAMNPPPPQPNPEMVKIQAQQQLEQSKLQGQQQADAAKLQAEQAKAQIDGQIRQSEIAAEDARNQREQQAEAIRENAANALDQRRLDQEHARKQQEITEKYSFEQWKTENDNRAKIEIAEITAGIKLSAEQAKAATEASEGEPVTDDTPKKIAEMHQAITEMAAQSKRPKKSTIKRADGTVSHEITTIQ